MSRFMRKLPEPARKGLWFVAIWGASVLTLTIVAYGIRALIL